MYKREVKKTLTQKLCIFAHRNLWIASRIYELCAAMCSPTLPFCLTRKKEAKKSGNSHHVRCLNDEWRLTQTDKKPTEINIRLFPAAATRQINFYYCSTAREQKSSRQMKHENCIEIFIIIFKSVCPSTHTNRLDCLWNRSFAAATTTTASAMHKSTSSFYK